MTSNHRPLEESDIELIERIRSTPCLYDTNDPDFRLVYKKEQQWQTVAEGLAMSHWEARKRWTVLRDRYARELKQLLLHPDSMEYGKNEFFHRMDFLRNFVKKRSVRKKCNSSSSHSEDMMMNKSTGQEEDEEDDKVNKSVPIKIFKVDNSVSSFESHDNRDQQNQQQTHRIYKSFIIDEDMMMKKATGQGVENEEDEVNKAIPVKIFKVDNNVSSFKPYDNQEQQHHRQMSQFQQRTQQICKSYIIDDSQDSTTTGRYSYIEQEANNADSNHVEEQEYHDYVEDTSAAYEAVDEDHETESPHYVSNRSMSTATVGSSNSNKIVANASFTAATESKLTQLPQLQQRPSNDAICTHTVTTIPNEPSDSEEYFSKTIALYLKQLSRRYKIKAKVEMMQILEKYIGLEETKDNCK